MKNIIFYIILVIFLGTKAHALPFEKGVVVSQSPDASKLGAQILSNGGNAFDAAVATGYALGFTEPGSCGIGGGGFALIYLAKTGELKAIDFRERAPLKINEYEYSFKTGPRSSGVPGTVAGFQHLRENYGTKSLKEILEPVILLGKEINPELAITHKDLAENGEKDFYKGKLARQISAGIQKAGGIITLKDLKKYKVYEEGPVCGTYRDEHKVCTFPLPSSAAVIIQALNILENFDLVQYNINSPERLHILIETMKYIFKDRATLLGDSRFNEININKLTSKSYARVIAEKIKHSKTAAPACEINTTNDGPETTHYTVVDKWGNIATVTVSLNLKYGSKFTLPGTGILMNNTLDDFSLDKPNEFMLVGNCLNYPEPGKTPLSSMSPTIVLNEKNEPVLALGSPGGPTIINAVLQVILNYIDHEMPLDKAVESGRLHHQWLPDMIFAEESLLNAKTRAILEKKYNHKFPEHDDYVWSKFYWAVEAVELDNKAGSLTGVADPRRGYGVMVEN